MLVRVLFVFAVLVAMQSVSFAEHDWPQFLGPNRNGVSNETGLLDHWPSGGPKEVWRTRATGGMSGIAILDGQLYTMTQSGGKQRVLCVDAKSGEKIWETPVADAYENGQGDGPRATPTVEGDTVFVYTGEGILVALNSKNGEKNWAQNVVKAHGGKAADYGMASSPLVANRRVIVTVGGPKATLAAFHAKTGEPAWTASSRDPAGYSSPTILKVGEKSHLVSFTGASVLGVDADSGKVLWRYPFKTDYDCNIAVPIAIDGSIFVSAGESHGCVLLKLTPSGDAFDVSEAWTSFGPKSSMRNEWQTSVEIDGFLYGFDNVGSAGQISHLNCTNAKTGKRIWQEVRFGKGNLIAAEGKLFMTTMKGEFIIANASPDGYSELGRKRFIKTTRQSPALSNGLIFIRDDSEIVCLDIRNRQK